MCSFADFDYKSFRKDVEEALSEVSKKYGLDIKAGKVTYDTHEFTCQLKCEKAGADAKLEKFKEEMKLMEFTGFKFEESDLGKELVLPVGKTKTAKFTIIGLKPGNKYNVELKRDNGQIYGYTASAVLKALGRPVA